MIELIILIILMFTFALGVVTFMYPPWETKVECQHKFSKWKKRALTYQDRICEKCGWCEVAEQPIVRNHGN